MRELSLRLTAILESSNSPRVFSPKSNFFLVLKKYKADAVSSSAAPNVTLPFKPNSSDFRSVLSSALGFSFLPS